jgi:hypothetical protein
VAADDGFRHRFLLFVLLGFGAVWCCVAEAVETPKHGRQGLGQHLLKDAKRKETALLMTPSEGQTGQRCAMVRNGG